MALVVDKSMSISDFLENWQHIAALVESEYEAVKDCPDGYYELHLDLLWDCEEAAEEGDGTQGTWAMAETIKKCMGITDLEKSGEGQEALSTAPERPGWHARGA